MSFAAVKLTNTDPDFFWQNTSVPAFQRLINEFITRNQLLGANVYLDNLTVWSVDQCSNDQNLKAIKEAAQKEQFTFNEDKRQYNCSQIQHLGHVVGKSVIKSDLESVAVLDDLKPPQTKKELQRILGLFSYYTK